MYLTSPKMKGKGMGMPAITKLPAQFYWPVDLAKQEIRLLEILPARGFKERVKCRMVNATIEKDANYIALSYLWDSSATTTETVTINSTRLQVNTELASALRHIRAAFWPEEAGASAPTPASTSPSTPAPGADKSDAASTCSCMSSSPSCTLSQVPTNATIPDTDNRHRSHSEPQQKSRRGFFTALKQYLQSLGDTVVLPVWVDAFCINQADAAERDAQTSTTRRVFKGSRTAVAWLGAPDNTSAQAISTLRGVDEAMPPTWGDPGDRALHPADYAPDLEWTAAFAASFAAPTAEEWEAQPWRIALKRFLARPYWSRCWLVQELLAADHPCLLLGTEVIPWRGLVGTLMLCEEMRSRPSRALPREISAQLSEEPHEFYGMVQLAVGNLIMDDWCARRSR